MHILITGAAGMVGRKLTERLVADGGLNGQPIEKLTLVDVVEPDAPEGFTGMGEAYALDIQREDAGRKLVAGRPDVIFHLAAVVSGEAEADFEKGYRINLVPFHYLLEAIRCAGDGYHPKLVFTSSIAVFGAPFPSEIPDDFHHTPLTSYGAQKGTEQGCLRFLLQHHPRAARRQGSGAAGRGERDALAREPAPGRRLPGACRLSHARAARVADENVVRRIRREPDPTIMKIVSGWPTRFDARRARSLGFKVEDSFEDIIRVPIDEELGGKVAARSEEHTAALQ